MPGNLYCESCCRFLRGELSVIMDWGHYIDFEHHHDVASFTKAILLPCAICSLAHQYAEFTPPQYGWVPWTNVRGQLSYDEGEDTVTLRFEYYDQETSCRYESAWLLFVPWPSTRDYSISQEIPLSNQAEPAINFLTKKYQDCRNTHVNCRFLQQQVASAYPARLLQIGTEECSQVILRDATSFRDEDYTCLSHCWGDVKLLTLNADTHKMLAKGLDPVALPKTYRDAIYVTRCLGIEYIWIDSLCIFQDDKDDWAAESRRMGDIYANAACTIAATAAHDSRDGLFHERHPKLLCPRRLDFDFRYEGPWFEQNQGTFPLIGAYLCDVRRLTDVCIGRAPLNQRAWVSQERQLSRRLLHFTGTQIFWECNECQACETYPDRLPPWARSFWRYDATALKKRVHELLCADGDASSDCSTSTSFAPGLDEATYYAWLTFRDQYSAAALTYGTDKLVAIQGIVNWMSRVTDSEFKAGLWLCHIIEELCWSEDYGIPGNRPTPAPKLWRAPTWSWACSDDSIVRSMLFKFHGGHRNLRTEAAVVELSAETKISGQLDKATLKLRCRPLPARLRSWQSSSIQLYTPKDELMDYASESEGIGSAIRYRQRGQVWQSDETREEYLIVLQRCLHQNHFELSDDLKPLCSEVEDRFAEGEERDEGPVEEIADRSPEGDHESVEALFIRALDNAGERYERVGLIDFDGNRAAMKVMRAHCLAEESVITLV